MPPARRPLDPHFQQLGRVRPRHHRDRQVERRQCLDRHGVRGAADRVDVVAGHRVPHRLRQLEGDVRLDLKTSDGAGVVGLTVRQPGTIKNVSLLFIYVLLPLYPGLYLVHIERNRHLIRVLSLRRH